jgi:hypothetical protein
MSIDKALRIYSDFLNASWHIVNPLLIDKNYTSNASSISDWLQANWELLVERKILGLNEYLEVYGDGADYNGESSRMTDVGALPTFSIKIIVDDNEVMDLLNNESIIGKELIFERLVGFNNGFYEDAPPFIYVLVQDENAGIERVLSLKDIKFELKKI